MQQWKLRRTKTKRADKMLATRGQLDGWTDAEINATSKWKSRGEEANTKIY